MVTDLIVVFYAYDYGKRAGNNISNQKAKKDIYLKNATCTLVSAKHYNPCADVALITNTDIPDVFQGIFNKNQIKVFNEPYDDFLFEDCPWTLAFYRFNALTHILKKYSHYKRIIMLECDMYVQANLDNVFIECEQNILLHDLEHSLDNKSYKGFMSEVEYFTGERNFMVQYEGGFLAINRETAIEFDLECHKIYEKMREMDFVSKYGDMFILSLAANALKDRVKNAAAYVHIFWTGWFRHISTCYEKDPVCVLHVPDEKERGMIKIFDNYLLKDKFPSNSKVWKLFYFKHRSLKNFLLDLIVRRNKK